MAFGNFQEQTVCKVLTVMMRMLILGRPRKALKNYICVYRVYQNITCDRLVEEVPYSLIL